MQSISEIKIIDKREAEILYKALHHWIFSHQLKKLAKPDLLELDDLYRELKAFLSEE